MKEVLKIVVLQSGEQLIGGLVELTDDEGNGICYSIKHPYVIKLVPTGKVPREEETEFRINFNKWMPFSPNVAFRISYSSVATIGDVDKGVHDVYMEKFGYLYEETSDEVVTQWQLTGNGETND